MGLLEVLESNRVRGIEGVERELGKLVREVGVGKCGRGT